MILSALVLGLSPLVLFQEPEETKLEAAQRKVTELEAELDEALRLHSKKEAALQAEYAAMARFAKKRFEDALNYADMAWNNVAQARIAS